MTLIITLISLTLIMVTVSVVLLHNREGRDTLINLNQPSKPLKPLNLKKVLQAQKDSRPSTHKPAEDKTVTLKAVQAYYAAVPSTQIKITPSSAELIDAIEAPQKFFLSPLNPYYVKAPTPVKTVTVKPVTVEERAATSLKAAGLTADSKWSRNKTVHTTRMSNGTTIRIRTADAHSQWPFKVLAAIQWLWGVFWVWILLGGFFLYIIKCG